jgi:hypothetical protein
MELDFRHLFSGKYGVSPEQFERKLFRRCLFRHALPFAWFLQRCDPDFFREDYEMLRDVATARNTEEVICEVNRFFGRNARDKNILRTAFYFRVSGKRVLKLYRQLIRLPDPSSQHSAEPAEISKTLSPSA